MKSDKTNLMMLRRFHGRIHDAVAEYRSKSAFEKFVKHSIKKTEELDKNKTIQEPEYPIDAVVTWVDGSDPLWQAEKAKFTSGNTGNRNDNASRYRTWDSFRYWFRAIEKNAPWIRTVYLVTWGHLPQWLNTACPKLKIIKHEDIIPTEYLPTFNSHTIEWFLWRIPGLSEQFIYFNDDVFITNPVKKSDFFTGELPRYSAIAEPVLTFADMNAHRHARFNCNGIINSAFNINECIRLHPEDWFNHQYNKKEIEYNTRAYSDGFISGMFYNHLGIPFRKNSFKEFSECYPEQVKATCMRKVRTSDDIMHQVVQMWDICRSEFDPVPSNHYGILFFPMQGHTDAVLAAMDSPNYKMVCINDHEAINDEFFKEFSEQLELFFNTRFADVSCFELAVPDAQMHSEES